MEIQSHWYLAQGHMGNGKKEKPHLSPTCVDPEPELFITFPLASRTIFKRRPVRVKWWKHRSRDAGGEKGLTGGGVASTLLRTDTFILLRLLQPLNTH